MAETLVLGLGNILLGDEGVGSRVVERLLEQYELPKGVRAIDGGTLGMALLPYLEEASRLVLVDAVEIHRAPGTLVRLAGDEIPGFFQEPWVSSHQTSLHNLVTVALLQGYLPEEVVFWGVQIESVGVRLDLSTQVEAQLDVLVENVVGELARWEIYPQRRAA